MRLMRLKYIQVTPEWMLDTLLGRTKPFDCLSKVPKDMRIVNITMVGGAAPRNIYQLIVESEKFPDLSLGDEIPELVLICKTRKEK